MSYILQRILCVISAILFTTMSTVSADSLDKPVVIPAPTAQDWTNLGKLPDWSGVWFESHTDQSEQTKTNMPPWTPAVAEQVNFRVAEQKAGRSISFFINCLPLGMPSWMLHNRDAMEILFTPGRVTMLGDLDSGRMRRIYTDGREHPEDLDLTLHGHSVGHWEGDTLVVDTVGVVPQAYIAMNDYIGIPNNGDMHITERIHLVGKDVLHDDLEITAPKVLTKPWKTTRIFFRQRARKFDIVEGHCLNGNFAPGKDKNGNDIYVPIQNEANGIPVLPK
jgi:hypothetical protein